MNRRTALKIVTLGALSPAGPGSQGKGRALEAAAWTPEHHEPHFFTQDESEFLDQLMEMIIPEDSHSPGAHAAKVSLFANLMVATSGDNVKSQWRKGLQLMLEEASRSSPAMALEKASAHEGEPRTELEHFFAVLKEMTVNGYYTSAIGIHQDLQYVGNTYLASFPGCTPPEHQS